MKKTLKFSKNYTSEDPKVISFSSSKDSYCTIINSVKSKFSYFEIYLRFTNGKVCYDQSKNYIEYEYLSNKEKLPTIYDISRVQSFNLKVPSDAEYKDKGSAGIFNGWRSTVYNKYKLGEINLDTLMNDIDSLSVMEEVYEARKIVEDANASNGKFVSGVGFGFFENNTVLDPINQKPKN